MSTGTSYWRPLAVVGGLLLAAGAGFRGCANEPARGAASGCGRRRLPSPTK